MSIQVSTTGAEIGSRPSASNRDVYLAHLLELAGRSQTADRDLLVLRDRAKSLVQEQTFPTTRHEEWRFTDLSSLLQVSFDAVAGVTPVKTVEPWVLPEAVDSRLVFVDGVYAPELSAIAPSPGIYIGNVSNLPETERDRLVDYLGKLPGGDEVFTALNTAGLTDTAVIWVQKNQVVETPIHVLLISTSGAQPTLSLPRCLVIAEPNSAVTWIEDYASTEGTTPYFTNAVTEIWLGENAQVNHSRIQRDALDAFHIGKTAVSQARDSRYTCNAISLGATLSRHNLEIFQIGEQTETILNGLTMISGEQLSDTHSTLALTKPYGISRQLHKCIIGGKAHAVFNGKVFVPKAAQQTDAGQLNRNLLLSPKARVDTKPQLEIVADNVKCTHGATVSQLDENEVFYLQSRGIDAASAQSLLVYAFAFEIFERLPVPSLQRSLSDLIARSAH